MDSDGGVAETLYINGISQEDVAKSLLRPQRTMLASHLDRVLRLLQVGASHHHLFDTDRARASENVGEIIGMRSLAVVDATEHGIAEIDANLRSDELEPCKSGGTESGLRTNINEF